MRKFQVDTYYRFKKAKNGVCLGMEIDAETVDDAIEKAKAKCIGPKWPARVYAGSNAREVSH